MAVTRGPDDDPNLSDDEIVRRRTAWFGSYTAQLNVFASPRGEPYTCPCCGHPTLPERGVYDICGDCGWEDDGQDDHDSGVVRGGPNGRLSLDAARLHSRLMAEYEAGMLRRRSRSSSSGSSLAENTGGYCPNHSTAVTLPDDFVVTPLPYAE